MKTGKICVVGSSNIDLVSYVPRLPRTGETLHGSRFAMGFGGKGANQAVMAARLGGDVAMVTRLGDDLFGRDTLANFEACGIDTRGIGVTSEAFSGVAPIAVDPQGNNTIIIVPGANDLLSVEDLEAAGELITTARVVICQLEIRLEVSLAALRMGKQAGATTIFNPAPAQPDLPAEMYRLSDIFCPNETEAEMLTGMPVASDAEAEAAARALLARGAGTVILTLGARGSLLATVGGAEWVPAVPVRAVDTTGAGDAFVGSLAYFLAAGCALREAVLRANQVAAISVQRPGTQTSFPARDELPTEWFRIG